MVGCSGRGRLGGHGGYGGHGGHVGHGRTVQGSLGIWERTLGQLVVT